MRTRPMLLCLALLGALPSSAVHAQSKPPSLDDAKAAAKAWADNGQEHYLTGNYDAAIASFTRADQEFHAPTFVLMIARAQERLGRLREARTTYQRVIDEQLTHYAPKVFFEAQAAAKKELEALSPRIPTLQVNVTGAPAKDLQLTVDGQPARVGHPLSLDPGEHTTAASAPGYEQATQRVTLREAEKAQVRLDLRVLPPPTAPLPPAPAPKALPVRHAPPAAPSFLFTRTTPSSVEPVQPQNDTSPMVTGGIGLTAVGGVGLIVSTILFTASRDSIPVACQSPEGFTYACGERDDEGMQDASAATGIVSLAALGVGIPLWIVGANRKKTTDTASRSSISVGMRSATIKIEF